MTPGVVKILSFLSTLLRNFLDAYKVEAFPLIKTHADIFQVHLVPESCFTPKNALCKAFSSFVRFCAQLTSQAHYFPALHYELVIKHIERRLGMDADRSTKTNDLFDNDKKQTCYANKAACTESPQSRRSKAKFHKVFSLLYRTQLQWVPRNYPA